MKKFYCFIGFIVFLLIILLFPGNRAGPKVVVEAIENQKLFSYNAGPYVQCHGGLETVKIEPAFLPDISASTQDENRIAYNNRRALLEPG
ncbi:MAG: hypothetical protein HON48_14210 [Desulfobacula sp.]|nr:hypothetical protein [Desulfobacula sp.]